MTDAAEYLLVLYMAERQRSPPIPPGDVATELDRSPPAATEMLQRLASEGLVTYEAYEGATLTEEGRDRAAELYETYDTLEQFFRDVLELDGAKTEAMQLAGAISPTVADRLAATLLGADGTDDLSDHVPSTSSTERSSATHADDRRGE